MIDFLKKIGIDIKAIKFIIVGIINTLFGSGLMFVLYNCFSVNYYISSFCNYFFGSILSYFLNKYFTFNYKKRNFKTVVKFALNILICYLIAYGAVREIIKMILVGKDIKVIDNISMFGGMFAFVALNYFSQRFLVFKEEKD